VTGEADPQLLTIPRRASYEPIATTVGEVSGKRIDTTADAPPGVGFLECVDPCVPLFKTRR